MSPNTSQRMLAEIVPPKILPRSLGRFDLVVLYFALIFGSYGAAQMASEGWVGIPMMLLAAATFLVPCSLCAYELGTLLPGEGGIYVWAHKTAGPVHGFIAGWLSWFPILFVLPAGAITIVSHLQYATGSHWSITQQATAQCLVVLFVLSISMLRLSISQMYLKVMFFVSIATALAVLAAGLLNGSAHTPVNEDIVSLDITKHGSLYSAAILWLLGVEVPFNMGAEFKETKRAAGIMLLWGGVVVLLSYIVGIAGVLLTTPIADIDSTSGVAKGVGRVWPSGGVVVAFAICLAVTSQHVGYMSSFSRLLMISGIERRLPAAVGQVNEKSKVPLLAMLLQGLGAIVVVLVFSTQPNFAVAFNLCLAMQVAVWCAALFYIYAGVVVARRRFKTLYQERGSEVWKIPGGNIGLWVVALVGAAFNVVAIYYIFAIPLTQDISPPAWRLWLFVLCAVVLGTGAAIFFAGRKNAERVLKLEERL